MKKLTNPASPFADPLTFWSPVLIRLGVVIGLCAIGPAIIDYVFFRGTAIIFATIAIYTLAPIAALCLVIGGALWIALKFRR